MSHLWALEAVDEPPSGLVRTPPPRHRRGWDGPFAATDIDVGPVSGHVDAEGNLSSPTADTHIVDNPADAGQAPFALASLSPLSDATTSIGADTGLLAGRATATFALQSTASLPVATASLPPVEALNLAASAAEAPAPAPLAPATAGASLDTAPVADVAMAAPLDMARTAPTTEALAVDSQPVAMAAPTMLSFAALAVTDTSAAATTNPIIDENTLHRTTTAQWQALGMTAGETPRDVWDAAQSNKIEGFTTDISYNLGQTVQFKINVNGTAAATLPYRIEIFRLGYYGGDGATLVTTINNADGTVQPNPVVDARHLVDAGNWNVTDSWAVPTTAKSGIYLARLDRLDASGNVIQGASNQIPFIVRNDASTSDIVLQTSDTTWQAYNAWGGNNSQVGSNLYPGVFPEAYAVSYNRPYLDRQAAGQGAGPQDYLFGADYAALYWLEKNGYDVSYISGVDTDRLGAANLEQHKALITVGHDEYWSGGQRANVTAARDAGVNLLFLTGNDLYWKTRYEASIAGTPTDYRTLVTYKETATNYDPNAPASAYANTDPSNQWTGTWRDLRFVDAVDANGVHTAVGAEPENSLTGQLFAANGEGQFGGAINVPQTYTSLRQWRGSAVQNSTGTFDIAPGIVGYEWDISPVDASRPAGLIKLSETTIPWTAVLQDQGNIYAPGTPTHTLTVYRAPSGALVFGAGTVFWSWGLSNEHDQYAPYAATIENPIIKQFTVNMLADMGIQPGSLEAGLIAATASADKTAATVTHATLPTSVNNGQTLTLSGTATDPNPTVDHGVVALVEVSLDGGATWRPATGTTNWTYEWTPTAAGTYQIKARAIDDSLNTPTLLASQSISVVGVVSNESMFTPAAAPDMIVLDAWDPTDYELGMKFSAKVAGTITDLKYYRGAVDADNTDVRTLHLWDASNPTTPLATVTITSGVGASGWQTAHLTTPVQIAANTTYIVSYGTTENYAKSDGYFATAQTDAAGNLTVAVGGGVFAIGPGALPSLTSGNANYWADVVFKPGGGGGSPPQSENMFTPAAAPDMVVLDAWDPTDYELGMKFSAKVAGTITDLKYYRGAVDADNVDTRTLHLWDASNPTTPLATITITSGVGASGWQTAHLAAPVHINANTTYIVSYGTTENYAKSDGYFATAQTDAAGNLTVPVGGGVFAVGPGGFPALSSGNANYWADVTFVADTAGSGGNVAPRITSNGGGSSAALAIAENSTSIGAVTATDANAGDTVGFSLSGTDAALFNINAATGALTFKTAPNFEAPTDAGANRVYDVVVTAKDQLGAGTNQALAITVTNVDEAPAGALHISGYQSATASAVTLVETNGLAADPDSVVVGSTHVQWQRQSGASWVNVGTIDSNTLAISATAGTYRAAEVYTDAFGAKTVAGIETAIVGKSTNDALSGTAGANITLALGGNDTIAWSTGADVIDGGIGTDTVSFAGTTQGVTVNLGAGVAVPGLTPAVAGGTATGADLGATQYLVGIENVIGGSGADTFIGYSGTVNGGGGTDTIVLAGTSTAINAALDSAIGAVEKISAAGATAAVTLGLANQTEGFALVGSSFGDRITGSLGNDTVTATVDNVRDVYNGNSGTGDTVNYAAYTSALTVNLTAATAIDTTTTLYSIVTGSGVDATSSDAITGFENFTAGSGADKITANNTRNVLTGGAGNDTFIFTSATNAGGAAANAATRDVVTDFTQGADTIDIAQIAHGTATPWVFDGKVAASAAPGAAGHVHYFIDASGNTIIEGQTSTTASVSFQIELKGQYTLTTGSFHL